MPVTKTAKRALRSAKRKEVFNAVFLKKLSIALRTARKKRTKEAIIKAVATADRAAKKKIIHKNKAARIKASLAKLMPKTTKSSKKK